MASLFTASEAFIEIADGLTDAVTLDFFDLDEINEVPCEIEDMRDDDHLFGRTGAVLVVDVGE